VNQFALWQEIAADTAKLGYAGKTDVEVATLLNQKRAVDLGPKLLNKREVLDAIGEEARITAWIDAALATSPQTEEIHNAAVTLDEYAGSDAVSMVVGSLCRKAVETLVSKAVFSTANLTALATAARDVRQMSRAEELGLGTVEAVHVWQARTEFGG